MSFKHNLICGESTKLMRELPRRSFDMIATDPPWGADALPLYQELAVIAPRLLKPNGHLLILLGNTYEYEIESFLRRTLLFRHRFVIHYKGFWMKLRHARGDYRPMLWFQAPGTELSYCDVPSIKTIQKKEKQLHPWQAPEGVFSDVMKALLPTPGAIVFDPFMGSGTTGINALSCGHQFFGVDQDPMYVETAGSRLDQWIIQNGGLSFANSKRNQVHESRESPVIPAC